MRTGFTKIIIYGLLSFLIFSIAFGQNNGQPGGFWNQLSLNGAISLEGLYRTQENYLNSRLREDFQSSLFRGQFLMRSRSYIWHPSLMLLDLDLEYQPGAGRYEYLVIPDRSETVTAERGRIEATFFDQRPMTLSFFTGINHAFSNRELLTNIETFKTDFGGRLSFRNRTLPLTLSYLQEDWSQKELEIGREFRNYRKMFQAEANKSFGGRDSHQLMFSQSNHQREYGNADRVNNDITDVNLRDRIYFNKDRSSMLHSFIWYYHQVGSQDFDRFQLNENLIFKLPANFRFLSNYQYSWYEQPLFNSQQHNAGGQLEHQLFLSLRSHVFYDYSRLKQTQFDETLHTAGLGFNYRKKIPTGHLSLDYEIRQRRQDHNSLARQRQIINEEQRLDDGQTVLLNHPYVEINSVIVHDLTNTIIYQLNIDYVLISRGEFVEIQRLPGGQIADGETVYIDYIINQQDSYQFDSYNNNFRIHTSVFHNLLEVYFRYFDQDYNNIITTNTRILNYIAQNVYGIKSTIGPVSGGIEYDYFRATIVPYHSKRYYLSFTQNFLRNWNILLSANFRDYLLTQENERQQFADFNGRLIYYFWRQSRLTIEGGYRWQDGRGIDLDLRTFRVEFSSVYRKIIFAAGFETYRRDYIGEIINFAGTFVRVTRQF
jgi:hypothetical protein